MRILKPKDWSLRKNHKRTNRDAKFHPAIVVGEEGNKFVNIGVTHKEKRGHHKNIPLSHNPEQGKTKQAYLRDDI